MNDWLRKAWESNGVEKVPRGFYTMSQLVAAAGKPKSTIKEQVGKLVKCGKLKAQPYRINMPGQGVRPMVHYGPFPECVKTAAIPAKTLETRPAG